MAFSITDLTSLKAAITNYLASDAYDSYREDFIGLAEQNLNEELRVREMVTNGTVTPSAVNTYVSLPTGFLEIISFNDDLGEPLREVTHEVLADMAYASSSARPEYYAIGSRIDFERLAPAGVAAFDMVYYQALDLITDDTNAVLTRYPGLYLYGALVHAEPFIGNVENMALWKVLYNNMKNGANNTNRNNKRSLRVAVPTTRRSSRILSGY